MKLAKENGCIEVIFLNNFLFTIFQVSLEEVYRTGYSEFKIFPKSEHEEQFIAVINYGDSVRIESVKDQKCFLNVF